MALLKSERGAWWSRRQEVEDVEVGDGGRDRHEQSLPVPLMTLLQSERGGLVVAVARRRLDRKVDGDGGRHEQSVRVP